MTHGGRTPEALDRLTRPLRRLNRAGGALATLAVVTGLLAIGAWFLRLDVGGGGLGGGLTVVVVWMGVGLGVALVAFGWARAGRSYQRYAFAERLEAMGVMRRGSLVALLESQATGTSPELVGAADKVRAEELLTASGPVVHRMVERMRRRALWLLAGFVVGISALLAARPARGPGALLWQPMQAIETLLAPITLVASPTVVDRGGTVDLELQAVGQRSATLWRRAPGEPWSRTTVRLDTAGRAAMTLAPIESDLYLRLSSGSRTTDTTRIRVRLPAFLGDLRLGADYPDYLELESEPLSSGGDPLLLPVGTIVTSQGVASVSLASAAWETPASGRLVPLTVDGPDFEGSFRPAVSGEYTLRLVTMDGRPLSGEPVRIPVTVIPDSLPVVDVVVPGTDTIVPAGLIVPLIVDLRDDHGVVRADLLVRPPGGPEDEWLQSLRIPDGSPARSLVTQVLDLSGREFLAGDTIRYSIRAFDNSPMGQMGVSKEFLLIIPTDADERSAQRAATAEIQDRLDSLVAAGRDLQRETEALASQRQRGEGDRSSLGFEEAQQAEVIAEDQEEVLRGTEEIEAALDALRDAVESGGLSDTALARQLEEIRDQLDQALSTEMRARLDDLQRALSDLDPQAMREALQRLAEAQQELQDVLERNRELLERAALDGELSGLQRESEDLARAQQEWNRTVERADSVGAAGAERALADRADSVATGLERIAPKMDLSTAREALAGAAKTAQRAAGQMREAESAVRAGDRQQARAAGERAEAAMDEVGRAARTQRQQQQEAWRVEVMEALDRALTETAGLSRQQLAVMEQFRRASSLGGTRREQAAVEESVQKLSDQIRAVSGQHALVPPQIAVALAVARRHMAQAREAVSSASTNPREAAEQAGEAVDALNVAAFAMVRAKDDVSGAGSGSGMSEAAAQMQDAAQQQSQLAEDAATMLPMAGNPTMQMQLRRLAARQQALAEAMDRLRAEGSVEGARDLAAEAHDLARRLDGGQLDRETIDRQERLFRRMLDAGRTLLGDEEDERKERQSVTAREGLLRIPPLLRRNLEGGDRIRLPSWEELRRLSPEERRLVTEYFRRLTSGGRR